MVITRSSGGGTAPEQTALQLQRDRLVGKMNMDWMPQNGRPHLRSRGLNNGLNLCYQNAVLQAFMHQPPFLNWILQHDMTIAPCSTTPCLKCHLRQLVETYWGPTNAYISVPQNASVQGIANLAFGTLFAQGWQEDANLFYNWIVDSLREAPTNPTLDLQIDTLYSVTLQCHDRCKVCGTPHDPTLDNDTFINVGVDPNHTDLTQAIHASLRDNVDNVYCETCGRNQTKTRWTEIVAAPKILRIQLYILRRDYKIFHALTYPDILDLTLLQQVSTLPLRYQLSSVVAHHGDFVDAEKADEIIAQQLQKHYLEAASLAAAQKLQAKWDVEASGDEENQQDSLDDSQEEDDEAEAESGEEEHQDGDEDEEQQDSEQEEETSEVSSSEVSDGLQEALYNSFVHSQHNDTDAESIDSEELCRDADDTDPPAPIGTAASQAQDSLDTELSEMELSEVGALGEELFAEEPSKEPSSQEATGEQPLTKREKTMMGHYIASVREPDDAFSTINDSGVRSISHTDFLTNPQRSNGQDFQVYVLTYIRDDGVRNIPRSERWIKEVDGLMAHVSEGAVTAVRYPDVKPLKKQNVGQGEQPKRGTKRKRGKKA